MNQLATDLRKWAGGIEDASQITDERKLLKLFLPVHRVLLLMSNFVVNKFYSILLIPNILC